MQVASHLARISTGVKGLDELIEGGLIPGRVYLIVGPPGSGKTVFGMHFLLEGARRGEKVAYISLVQKPEEVVRDMVRFDPSIYAYVNTWKLILYDLGPILWRESSRVPTWRSVLLRIRDIVEDEKITRLVIDPLTAIDFPQQNPVEKRVELAKFIRGLEDLGVTAYLIAEMTDLDKYTEEHYLVSGIIMLHYFMHNGRMTRAIQVFKMRGTKHDPNLKLMRFTDKGLVVYNKSPFEAE
ncbi:RAD55 family ATPase [Pyrococcus yayanosii]|uniref:Recombinase related protein n=1 Tax=Pyrococcus yayanosii (strain CH1 / JCM 16557) TaxID=529709 RepID=F8AET2_PYRYC|nr:RAD55 family ATPase [Pyrococcus yayanosii]AEH24764.1 recombinase related protein [Pyrococcus yayanosii CH1]